MFPPRSGNDPDVVHGCELLDSEGRQMNSSDKYRSHRRIVAELVQWEVDALKRLQAETATELDALLPAILDRAFKGEL